METREQRGLELAATRKLRRKGRLWVVPSQTGPGTYAVDPTRETCSCPDFEARHAKCKHMYAVEFTVRRETRPDGTTTVTKTVRVTYTQDWPAYNAAQTTEKDRFQVLLADLCRGIAEPQGPRVGHPRLPLADAIFSAAFKVYSTVSGRRFMSDLREAHGRGLIARAPHYNSIFNYLESEAVTPILHDLIVRSSLPLKAVEVDFAADSSGFTTSRFTRWFDHKYGVVRLQHDWVKAHVMVGVKTNVITAVEFHGRNAADTTQLPALVETTAVNFTMAEVSADKAYGSVKNMNAIANAGAQPFIAFKTSNTGASAGVFGKMFHFFMYQREEFLAHYHKRSNVETTFSMVKWKFGDSLRSKTKTAMVNETLCKLLCHNLVVLIHEIYELGIDPVFWGTSSPAQQLSA